MRKTVIKLPCRQGKRQDFPLEHLYIVITRVPLNPSSEICIFEFERNLPSQKHNRGAQLKGGR